MGSLTKKPGSICFGRRGTRLKYGYFQLWPAGSKTCLIRQPMVVAGGYGHAPTSCGTWVPVLAQGAQNGLWSLVHKCGDISNSGLRGLPERQREKRETRAGVLLEEEWRRRLEGGGRESRGGALPEGRGERQRASELQQQQPNLFNWRRGASIVVLRLGVRSAPLCN